MPYQGAYQGQYAGFPSHGNGQQPPQQYHVNGTQHPMQQRPSSQQTYQTPGNGDIYSKQYYQPQQQQQRQYAASQPVQHSPQYPGYQHGQNLLLQYSATRGGQPYVQASQAPPAYQSPSPMLQQRPQVSQQPQALQYQQFPPPPPPPPQQQHRAVVSPQWPNQYIPPTPAAPEYPGPSGHPPVQTPVQRPPAAHVPRQKPVAASPIQSHHNALSSPDPLAGSPNLRQPQQALSKQQQQPRPSYTPVASKPKVNVTQTTQIPQQRIATHVEIPTMSQPAKRRRSNEGNPIPVCEGPSVDYQTVLLALSDEYIAAAYALQSLDTDEKLKEYHRLIAAGVGCLESVLKNYRHPDARREARIRLRLAMLLVEETENDEEAEETLSKGIALCERSRLVDLKYAMHHLLARLTFKRSPKAALKAVDKLVHEVEAFGLLHWTYAFRLLRVCHGMQIPGNSETAAMLKHLTAISTTAEGHRHIAIQITVAAIEAMIYLRSGSPDAVDLAQRAMASARTHQLGAEMANLPQVRALLDCLDLSCSLMNFDAKHTLEKMSQMHASMDPATRQSGWSKNGSFSIAMLPSTNTDLELDTLGIMKTTADGTASLNLRWMTQSGIYVIGYLLSGITYLHKDEEGKAQSFLQEGLKLNKRSTQMQQQLQSVSDVSIAEDQQSALDAAARMLLLFEHCGRFDWRKAREGIDQTKIKFAQRGLNEPDEAARTLLYLDAMCKQAQGDVQGALIIYQSPTLAFDPDVKIGNVERDFKVLSALNSIMILRTMGPEHVTKANNLHTAVEPYCLGHPNKSFSAAYFVTKATGNDSRMAIIKTKQYLHSAVNAARAAANNQLLLVVMNVMTDLFFHGIIGEQAEKSAGAGRTLAKKSGDQLWLSVADNMYAEIKERCGKKAEADAARTEGITVLKTLPDALKRTLALEAQRGQV